MSLQEHPPNGKRFLWISRGKIAANGDATQIVSRAIHSGNGRESAVSGISEFDAIRLAVVARCWRISPAIPGLRFAKRAILFAYVAGAISIVTAQRLIDVSRSWDA